MLAAGRRTYGRGLARSALSVSRCSRLPALGADGSSSSSAMSRAERVCPASTQAARQQHSGGSTPSEDTPTTSAAAAAAAAEGAAAQENMPWLKYQRSMYMRTGLQGIGTRRPGRDQLDLVSPAAGTAIDAATTTAGRSAPGASSDTSAQGSDGSNGASSSSSFNPEEAATATEAASTEAPAAATSAREASESADSWSSKAAAGRDEGLTSTDRRGAGAASSAAEEPSLFSLHDSPTDVSPAIVPSPWGGEGGRDSGSGSVDKDADEAGRVENSVRAHSVDSRREAALKAELERKFGTEPNREPGPEAAAAWIQDQGDGIVDDPDPTSAAEPAAAEVDSSDDSSSTQQSGGSDSSKEPPEAGEKRRRTRRAGRGQGQGPSHYQKQSSAWNNVHAKKNLTRLLAGLRKDYGVKELLNAHHVSEVRARTVAILLACDHRWNRASERRRRFESFLSFGVAGVAVGVFLPRCIESGRVVR